MVMDRQQHHHESTTQPPWGTLEELLLASAVNRHGTDNWDSIVMELQNRTSTFPPSLTSQHCIDKFNDLKRRFFLIPPNATTASLVDELRRLRVEELRREVQRRDVSIMSLESKLKRLEEERERSLKVKEEADLSREDKPSPDNITGKPNARDDSGDDRDDRSFNESNSTSQQKTETITARKKNDTVDEVADIKPEPEVKTEQDPARTGSDPKRERDWSHNGKSGDNDDDDDNNADKTMNKKKQETKTKTKLSRTGRIGESNELGESVGESKREEKDNKQNSDVQSSASLSLKKKKRRSRGEGGGGGTGVGSSSCEEPEAGDEVSPATKRIPAVKSEPLAKLLGIIRSHRLGSTFERRLRSQESERYRSLIRQHIDLRTIQSRLDKGAYSSSMQKFFRDVLLLFNNAIIFFRRSSPENVAARELRAIVLKEMIQKHGKPKHDYQPVTTKPEPKKLPVSLSKPSKSSSAMVACGKRSSVKATSENTSKKCERKERDHVKEKPKANEKKKEDSVVENEEKAIRKKRTKERMSVSGRKNTGTVNKNNGEVKHQYGGNELSSHDALEIKVDNKKESTTRKKQGAASFLKRMKQNSPSEVTDDDDDEDDDNDEDDINGDDDSSEEESKDIGKGSKEDKKRRSGRNNKNDQVRVTRSSKGRGATEERGRGKRAIGRPPKRQEGGGKRGRDNGDSEVGGGRARKRSRR